MEKIPTLQLLSWKEIVGGLNFAECEMLAAFVQIQEEKILQVQDEKALFLVKCELKNKPEYSGMEKILDTLFMLHRNVKFGFCFDGELYSVTYTDDIAIQVGRSGYGDNILYLWKDTNCYQCRGWPVEVCKFALLLLNINIHRMYREALNKVTL